MLLARLIRPAITKGTLTVIDGRGITHHFGSGAPSVTLRLHDTALHRELLLDPHLRFGEAYMDGRITLEDGDLYDLMTILVQAGSVHGLLGRIGEVLAPALRRLQQYNPIVRSRANVAHHYDLSTKLYELFLDRNLNYSCGYFTEPGMGLDEAQEAKMRHIAAKLMLKPGQHVLEIGCGWGGLALHIARAADVRVTGVTLSTEQLRTAKAKAEEAGLSDRVRFELRDYREVAGRFDRIVSVGMMEHVGLPHFRDYFGTIRDLLAGDGIALVHAVGRSVGPGSTNPWYRKYIFPGGYAPALSEVFPAIEKSGLWATDMEILRLHYAETARHWRARFRSRWDEARAMYDERFCRMWDFYLAGVEVAFRLRGDMIFQIQLTRSVDAVPLTRDYMVDAERTMMRQAASLATAAD